MSNQSGDQLIPADITSLSFDSFARDPRRDVVCLAPIRTTIRREEEIVLVRKVRKVEEIEAAPACPVTSETLSGGLTTVTVPAPTRPIGDALADVPNDVPADVPIADDRGGCTSREEFVVHSRYNCFLIDPSEMHRLQTETAVSRTLYPGTYTVRLKSGSFDYRAESGHPGEPLVMLWIYGGKVKNHKTGAVVNATWSTLNGYGDALTIDVSETAKLCGFFFDTYLEDNEGEVTVGVEGPSYVADMVVHSQRNCYYIDPDSMRRLEQTGVSKQLAAGSYALRITGGSFGYRTEDGLQDEPLVMLWIYGGRVKNRATDTETGATWVSLNGYDDVLMLDVMEPATLCAFFYDTYVEDNEGEVRMTLERF